MGSPFLHLCYYIFLVSFYEKNNSYFGSIKIYIYIYIYIFAQYSICLYIIDMIGVLAYENNKI